jgi:cytoskeletal protein CcmA (bactofilin family)
MSGNGNSRPALLTIVGTDARMEGKFDIANSIQVECEVVGELRVGERLVIGEKGLVNATVHTVDALIMGQFDGSMVATGEVEIAATGRVSGNIQTDSLVIVKGAFFSGNVTKIHADASRPSARAEPTGVQLYESLSRAERDERVLRSAPRA